MTEARTGHAGGGPVATGRQAVAPPTTSRVLLGVSRAGNSDRDLGLFTNLPKGVK